MVGDLRDLACRVLLNGEEIDMKPKMTAFVFSEISFHFVFDRRKSLIFPKVDFPRSLPVFISPQLGKKKEGIGEQES